MRPAVTADALDQAAIQAILARVDAGSSHTGAKLIARLDPPRVVWANTSAATLFKTHDLDTLTRQVFGRDATARGMNHRLGRLTPGVPHFERVDIATRFRRTGVTLACDAVSDGSSKAIVLQTPGAAFSSFEDADIGFAALPSFVETDIQDFPPSARLESEGPVEAASSEGTRPGWHDIGNEPHPDAAPKTPARYGWATDRHGAVVRVDPGLERVLGRTALTVGENLAARLRALGAGEAAQALDEGRSWPRLAVGWPMGEAGISWTVVLAGTPSPGSEGGFRGFLAPSSRASPPSSLPLVSDVAVEAPPSGRAVAADAPQPSIGAAPQPVQEVVASDPAVSRSSDGEVETSRSAGRPGGVAVEALVDGAAPLNGPPLPVANARLSADGTTDGEPGEITVPAAVPRSRVQPPPPVPTAARSKIVHLATFKTGGSTSSGQGTVKTVEPARISMADAGESLEAPQWAEAPDLLATPDDDREQRLSSNERLNFDAIRRTLAALPVAQRNQEPGSDAGSLSEQISDVKVLTTSAPGRPIRGDDAWSLLECLAIGILVVQAERPVYANRATLDLLGYGSVEDLAWTGLTGLFGTGGLPRTTGVGPQTITMTTRRDEVVAVDARMQKVVWEDGPATLISIRRSGDEEARARVAALGLDLRKSQVLASDLAEALDIAASGAGFLDGQGRILSLNRGGERLFGFDQREMEGKFCRTLIAPDQQAAWSLFFDGFSAAQSSGRTSAFRRFDGRHRDGTALRLAISLRRIDAAKICIVWQESAAAQGAETEIDNLRRDAERASALKSDFLAKVSHEIRTPLNAILGFTEIIVDERFGAIGNDRYRDYLKDIHTSGTHVLSLVNDLLDLSRIEAGALDLDLVPVNANVVVGECVATLQGQAHRDRIIIRTSLAARSPLALADERTFRQIVLNLLSNAVKFNEPGGQVIVSTAVTEAGLVVVRVRDTGLGMSDEEIQTAMMPYRQLATLKARGGSGLGLPLTKAMLEASRGSLKIQSKPGEGTLAEATFQHAPEAAVAAPGLSDSTAG